MSQKSNIYVSKNLKTIAVITLLSSLMWTGVSVYSAFTKKPDLEIKPELIKPVDASLDTETLQAITSKRQLTDDPQLSELLQQALTYVAAHAETEESTKTKPTPTKAPSKATINEVSVPTAESTPAPDASGSGANQAQ